MQREDQIDWDDAYANAAHIPDADGYITRWTADAAALRAATRLEVLSYGAGPREALDLLYPKGAPKGLMVFVHGGYWLRFDRSYWTQLAHAALEAGYAVALPSYPLCPEATLSDIRRAVARAVQLAAETVPGPIRLTGHSAGGQLAARMLAEDTDLPCRDRIKRALLISPLSDLRHMQKTAMAGPLHLDDATAAAESPLLQGRPATPVSIWVGADERPVFLDHARWLAEAWACPVTVEDGRHHFDIIDGLADPEHKLFQALFS